MTGLAVPVVARALPAAGPPRAQAQRQRLALASTGMPCSGFPATVSAVRSCSFTPRSGAAFSSAQPGHVGGSSGRQARPALRVAAVAGVPALAPRRGEGSNKKAAASPIMTAWPGGGHDHDPAKPTLTRSLLSLLPVLPSIAYLALETGGIDSIGGARFHALEIREGGARARRILESFA